MRKKRTYLTTVQVRQMCEEFAHGQALKRRVEELFGYKGLMARYQISHSALERHLKKFNQQKGTRDGRN